VSLLIAIFREFDPGAQVDLIKHHPQLGIRRQCPLGFQIGCQLLQRLPRNAAGEQPQPDLVEVFNNFVPRTRPRERPEVASGACCSASTASTGTDGAEPPTAGAVGSPASETVNLPVAPSPARERGLALVRAVRDVSATFMGFLAFSIEFPASYYAARPRLINSENPN